jgi:glutamate-ammonia-ligase adenylyltransferase
LKLVADIAGSAPRLADYLGRNAAVLDALMDRDFLGTIPARATLEDNLARSIKALPGQEGALDAARRFAREENFRIGVHVIENLTDAAHAGPAYASVAETVIAGLQPVIEQEMIEAHGRVPGGGFAVVALGKLGGREMTATSDLDLVFLYAHDAQANQSEGRKPLSTGPYFARAAQRFIVALTALTGEGGLYDVDMRLRPSGNQGPVAVSLASFAEYQRERAWTWERMALTRARVISGPCDVRLLAEDTIRAALMRPEAAEKILSDAREMRGKLAAQFPGRGAWDMKYAPGGLIDIEFIAQALQLMHASRADVLEQNTVAALTKLALGGALDAPTAETLANAARLQDALTQVLRIAVEGAFQPANGTPGLQRLLARAAEARDFTEAEAKLIAAQKTVRGIFTRIIGPL